MVENHYIQKIPEVIGLTNKFNKPSKDKYKHHTTHHISNEPPVTITTDTPTYSYDETGGFIDVCRAKFDVMG
jgi:hypothetical protein